MFQFPRLASCIRRMTVLQTAGLSHSEIPGSMVICTYPELIAAYHVLLRLHEPRHPPCALSYFLYDCRVIMVSGCRLSVAGLLPSSFSLLPLPSRLPLILSAVSREIFFLLGNSDSLKLKLKFYLSTVLSCVNMSKIFWKMLSCCLVVWLFVCTCIHLDNLITC